jgi:hypothetical protein
MEISGKIIALSTNATALKIISINFVAQEQLAFLFQYNL